MPFYCKATSGVSRSLISSPVNTPNLAPLRRAISSRPGISLISSSPFGETSFISGPSSIQHPQDPEQLKKQQLRNLLTTFQWRVQSAHSPLAVEHLLEEYTERCKMVAEAPPSSPGRWCVPVLMSPTATPKRSSMKQSRELMNRPKVSSTRSSHRVDIETVRLISALPQHVPTSFSTARALRQYRHDQIERPTTAETSTASGRHSDDFTQPHSFVAPFVGAIRRFFSPLHQQPTSLGYRRSDYGSNAKRPHHAYDSSDHAGRATGGTSAMLMFGRVGGSSPHDA